MNSVCIVGKIVEEPVKEVSSNGINFARFKVLDVRNNKDGNNDDLFEITVFRDLADIQLKCDQLVAINGKLTANNYKKDDKAYYNCSIIGNNITLIQ